MTNETLDVAPGPRERSVRMPGGEVRRVPDDWELLPPGDATLTRRLKKAGPSWTVKEKARRRVFSHGVWAPSATIDAVRRELLAEREDPAYLRRLEAGRERRGRAQEGYVEDFRAAVSTYLDFAPLHRELAERMATAIAAHATPVGSGTVARTQRIPIEERAEAATIAWLRHQTTGYDSMKIPRVRGKRREVRKQLARRSKELLVRYRLGEAVSVDECPFHKALG